MDLVKGVAWWRLLLTRTWAWIFFLEAWHAVPALEEGDGLVHVGILPSHWS